MKTSVPLLAAAAAVLALLASPALAGADVRPIPSGEAKTTLGPVQPVGPAEARVLDAAPSNSATASRATKAPCLAALAKADYGSQAAASAYTRVCRGCRYAQTEAPFTIFGFRSFSLIVNQRFCWDQKRKKAVQLGPRDGHSDVARKGSLAGISVSDGTPLAAIQRPWRGGRKGQVVMTMRFKEHSCGAHVACTDYVIYVTQYAHWDGNSSDSHRTTKK